MTPNLPPVLTGFSEPVMGPLKIQARDSGEYNDIASSEIGHEEWVLGWWGSISSWYSLRLGSPIARANGIGGEEIPDGLPPLPPVPEGYDHWVYRGLGWKTERPAMYSAFSPAFRETEWHDPMFYEEVGGIDAYHYIEAVKEPTSDPCESESPKPEEGVEEPIEVWNPLEHGIRNVPLMVPSHLHNRKVSKLESDLAAARADFETAMEAIEEKKDEIRNLKQSEQRLRAALEAGRLAIGEHFAPNDCYSTGPLTGDPIRDLVCCPACAFIAQYDALAPASSGKGEGKLHSEAESYRQTAKEVNRRAKACYINGVADGIDYALGLIPSPLNGKGDA